MDDVTQLFQSDGGEASSELKVALSNGDLPLAGSCVTLEHRWVAETEPALAKCFAVVEIDEPTAGKAVDMLLGGEWHRRKP